MKWQDLKVVGIFLSYLFKSSQNTFDSIRSFHSIAVILIAILQLQSEKSSSHLPMPHSASNRKRPASPIGRFSPPNKAIRRAPGMHRSLLLGHCHLTE